MNVLIAITRQLAQKTGGKINRALDWSPKRGVLLRLPGDMRKPGRRYLGAFVVQNAQVEGKKRVCLNAII
jgi:hypothetical protein